MAIQEDFSKLLERVKRQRDELSLKMHLASMEVRQEYEAAEKKWHHLKSKAAAIADEAVETSEDYIDRAKIVGEELKETYRRISRRLSG